MAALCVHRGVDPDAWDSLSKLSVCPNPRILVKFKSGDALIQRSRAIVASRFLEMPHLDVLLFLDDDIIYDPMDAVKICRLVHEQNLDIVGGPYVKKVADNNHFAIKTLDDEPLKFGKDGSCYEVRCVSTGFMAIHKRVLKEMAKTLPLCHPNDMKFYPFFESRPFKMEDGSYIYLSEDWSFCENARDLGFKVYADTTSQISHAGRYIYNWADIFRPNKEKIENFEYGDIDGVPYHQKIA